MHQQIEICLNRHCFHEALFRHWAWEQQKRCTSDEISRLRLFRSNDNTCTKDGKWSFVPALAPCIQTELWIRTVHVNSNSSGPPAKPSRHEPPNFGIRHTQEMSRNSRACTPLPKTTLNIKSLLNSSFPKVSFMTTPLHLISTDLGLRSQNQPFWNSRSDFWWW